MAKADSIDLARFPRIERTRHNELVTDYIGPTEELLSAGILKPSMISKPPKQTKSGTGFFTRRKAGSSHEVRIFHCDPESYTDTREQALEKVLEGGPYDFNDSISAQYSGSPGELIRAGVANEGMFVFKTSGSMTDEFGCRVYVIRRSDTEWEIHRDIHEDFAKRKRSKVIDYPEPWDPMPRVLEIRDSGLSA